MNDLENFLKANRQFRVYTGDITSGEGMRNRMFSDPTAELLECLNILLQQWPSDKICVCEKNSLVVFRTAQCSNKQHPPINEDNRSNYEVSVKLFLSEPDPSVVRECCQVIMDELTTSFIDQVIVALPPVDSDSCRQPLSVQFLQLWPTLEQMVNANKVKDTGVADLGYEDFRYLLDALSANNRLKPKINHYNVSVCTPCCDLIQLAKENNIEVLTHSDRHPFLTATQVQHLLTDCLKVDRSTAVQWKAIFACRYTVLEKCTSIIALKGYIVHFKRCSDT